MLIYHPAQDAYHCVFRMLLLIDKLRYLHEDKAKILDFYLAFPSALQSIRWPTQLSGSRRRAKEQCNPYRSALNPAATFRSMQTLQASAIRCIAAANIIDPLMLEQGILQRTEVELDDDIKNRIDHYEKENSAGIELIVSDLSSIELLGRDGLKARTSLMDFRYDPS